VLLFISAVKLICEIAVLALLGQGLLYVLAGEKRESNIFYQLFKIVTKPFTKVARFITPRQVGEHQVPFVAFFLLLVIWVVATIEKIQYCVGQNMEGCR
jgi:hypothetical protein